MSKEELVQFPTKMTPKEHEMLKSLAKQDDRSMAAIVRVLVRREYADRNR